MIVRFEVKREENNYPLIICGKQHIPTVKIY